MLEKVADNKPNQFWSVLVEKSPEENSKTHRFKGVYDNKSGTNLLLEFEWPKKDLNFNFASKLTDKTHISGGV